MSGPVWPADPLRADRVAAGPRTFPLHSVCGSHTVLSVPEGDTARPAAPSRNRKPTEWVHSIAFRCNDEQYNNLEALRVTFDPPTATEALRWVLSSPEGRELIAKKVRGEIE